MADQMKRVPGWWETTGAQICEGGSRCPVCLGPIRNGFAYFSFGADVDLLRQPTGSGLEGFCSFGFHGIDSEMRDSAEFCVADQVETGQLDIHFCSVDCLGEWLHRIVDYITRTSRGESPQDPFSDS